MKATHMLHGLGQRLWLNNTTRDLLDNGTPQCYINELSVTELTSHPPIFDQAVHWKLKEGKRGGTVFRAGAGGSHPRQLGL
jgi:transaldolase